jgi:Methyltransferase domain
MRMTGLVVSFNRHFFALALLACGLGLGLIALLDNPSLRLLVSLGIGLAVYFMVASIIASYFIYDASDLYRLTWWPARCLRQPPEDGIVVHAGFDPASPAIEARFPQMRLRILDFFDPRKTTEASIQRAHRLTPPSASSEQISASAWPVVTGSQDVVFALSAAHELRKAEERAAFFREARRVLGAKGRVIVIEQLRDLANFACFGLAAFHFLSRRTWRKSFSQANLTIADEFRITPFMRVFVLQAE